MSDYTDRPTIIVNTSDGHVDGVQVEGIDLPDNLRVIVRDWDAGTEPDANGDIYEDEEV